jgi:RimJ/RimL family protein N-acetyltransferase
MEISTRRCTVRRFTDADIDDFMRYRNDEHWMRYQDYKGRTRAEYAADLLSEPSLSSGAQFAIVDDTTGTLVGDVYVKQDDATCWIGYTVDPRHARQGYATEVLTQLLAWLREQGCIRVQAGVLPDNVASIKLLERLGFSPTGTTDDELVFALQLQPMES